MKTSIDDVFQIELGNPLKGLRKVAQCHSEAVYDIAAKVGYLLDSHEWQTFWKFVEVLQIRFETDLDGDHVRFTAVLKAPYGKITLPKAEKRWPIRYLSSEDDRDRESLVRQIVGEIATTVVRVRGEFAEMAESLKT